MFYEETQKELELATQITGRFFNLHKNVASDWERTISYYINNVSFTPTKIVLHLFDHGHATIELPKSKTRKLLKGEKFQNSRQRIAYCVSDEPQYGLECAYIINQELGTNYDH